MKSNIKLFARFASAIHARLVGLPLVLFISVLMLDIVHSLSQHPTIALVSSFLVALGIPIALLDFFFGSLHRASLPANTHARRMAWVYETLNLVLALVFIFSGVSRSIGAGFVSSPFIVTSSFLLTLSFVGILLGILTLWLGEEMVYGLQPIESGSNSSHSSPGVRAGEARKTAPLARVGHYIH